MPSPTLTLAAVSLGSNLGDRRAFILHGLKGLAALPGTRLIAVSSIYETDPVGGPEQGAYLNAAALLETTLTPHELLNHLLEIERTAGRERAVRWGPRTLDLDLLLYGDRVIDDARLILPHPRLTGRSFVLTPLTEIAPDLVHPVSCLTIAALLAICPDTAAVSLWAAPPALDDIREESPQRNNQGGNP